MKEKNEVYGKYFIHQKDFLFGLNLESMTKEVANYYLQKDVNIFSIKKEGFIGRYYRPIYRSFRKNVGSTLFHYVKKLSTSYKKFIS